MELDPFEGDAHTESREARAEARERRSEPEAGPAEPPEGGSALVRTVDLHKSFGRVHAVRGVSFDIRPGEVVGLVGENGAGKSTVISLLAGATAPDAGRIVVDGQEHASLTPAQARAVGIAPIWQEPILVPTLTVAENLGLGQEARRGPLFSRRATIARARRQLADVAPHLRPETLVADLSPADRQGVEITKAVGQGARVLLFDEPTAALGPRETERLFSIITRLVEGGCGVVYVSHRLEEVFRICNRVVVLRDGRVVGAAPVDEIDEQGLIRLMAGRELAEEELGERGSHGRAGDVVLSLRDVCLGRRLTDVSLDFRAGEIHGIAGIVGSGRSRLASVVCGLSRPTSGTMTLNDAPYAPSGPSAALARGVALVPEDRHRDGLFPEQTIATNVAVSSFRTVANAGLVTARAEAAETKPLLEEVDIRPRDPYAKARTLSGGNQQKLLFARALLTRSKVVVLDEPTRGIDVGAKVDIHRLVREMADRGAAVVVISSDQRELIALSDRVSVLARGHVVAELSDDITPEAIIAAATSSPRAS